VTPSGRNPLATDGPWTRIIRHDDVGAQTLDDLADWAPTLAKASSGWRASAAA
jgi:hypothetical protein